MSIERITDLDTFDPLKWPEVSIALSSPSVNASEAEQMAGILRGRKVTFLSIRDGKFSEDAMPILAGAIAAARAPLYITFSRCGLTNQDAIVLAGALKNANVERLNLSENEIGDAGARALAAALATNKRANLILQHNKIGPAGAEAIAEVVGAAGRHPYRDNSMLDLSYNQIGDEGAERVARALQKHPKTIMSINLEGNGIGLEGDKAMALHLPKSVHTVTYRTEEVDGKTFMKTKSHLSPFFSDLAEDAPPPESKTYTIAKSGLIHERKYDPDAEQTWTEWFADFIGLGEESYGDLDHYEYDDWSDSDTDE